MMTEIENNKVNSAKQIEPQFGEVYKCTFYEESIGSEVRGPRPVLIISSKWYNEESDRITIIPLTRYYNKFGLPKKVYVWEVRVKVGHQEGKVMTDQIHNIDKQRLEKKIGELSLAEMEEVMKQLRMLVNFFPLIRAKL
jgi:mRNA-degrading endonuclease toxin of MazEF toxin-antitoxin module